MFNGSARALRALGLPPRSEVITLIRTRTADGTPVVDVTDVVPIALLSEAGITVQEMTVLVTETEPVYRALDKIGLVIHHGIAEMSPATATDDQARASRARHCCCASPRWTTTATATRSCSRMNTTSPTPLRSPCTAKAAGEATNAPWNPTSTWPCTSRRDQPPAATRPAASAGHEG
jgi:hypothetical protein